jgi:hypothetical protein
MAKIIRIIILTILLTILFLITWFICWYFVLTEFNSRSEEPLSVEFYVHLLSIVLIIFGFVYYIIFFFKEVRK